MLVSYYIPYTVYYILYTTIYYVESVVPALSNKFPFSNSVPVARMITAEQNSTES